MYEYIDKMLIQLPSDMNGASKTPDATHIFSINDEADKLDKDKAQLFHHLVVKLLYLSHRSRQDIKMAVTILCASNRSQVWMITRSWPK